MGLLVLLVVFFSIPSVQTYIAKKATTSLNKTYGTSINVAKVHIKYNGQVALKEVYIADHHQDTLLFSQLAETSLLSISRLLFSNTMNLGAVDLDRTKFYITKYKGEENDNLYIFSHKFKSDKPAAEPFHLAAGNVNFTNGHFKFTNQELEEGSQEVINYKNLALNANDFQLDGEIMHAKVNNLYFDAENGYHIRGLQGDLKYSPEAIIVDDLALKTENSHLAGSVKIDITDNAFSDFVNKAVFDFQFTEASLSTTDLKTFYNGFGINREINFTGTMKGTLNDLYLNNINMQGLGNSRINGNLHLQQLFNAATNFRIDADLNQLQSNYYDLAGLLPETLGKTLPKEIMRLGVVNLKGRTIITNNSVYAKTQGSTGLGNIETDLELTNTQNIEEAAYVGDIKATDFQLGRLLDVQKLGRISFNFNVGGTGFSQELLNTRIRGKISRVGYNGYGYKDITVSGNLQNPIFNGQLQINDENAQLSFDGLVDVSKTVNNYDFTADIDHLNLAKLHFLNDSIAVLKGRVVMDMTGTTVDNAVGSIQFSEASFENANDLYDFNDFVISSSFSGNIRTISMNSPDIISGKVSGNFKVDNVVPLFRNAIGSLYTNYQPSTVTQDQFMNFNFQINSKIVEVFVPQIELEPETFIRGSVVSNDSDFKLTFRSPQIKAFGILAEGINMRVDNKNPLFNTFIEANSISNGFYGISDFNLINATLKDTLFMRSEFKGGPKNEDSFKLNFYHTINADNKSVVGFSKSGIKFKNNDWFINAEDNDANRIVFDNNFQEINIEELVMSHDRERISLGGTIQDSTAMDLKTTFNNVRLSHVTPYIDSLDLKGLMNGNLNLLKKNGAYLPESNISIDTFTVNNIALGNLNLDIEGNESLTNYDINARLVNAGLESLKASGMINVDQQSPYIDMDVQLQKLNLAAFSPLGGVVLSNIRGLASGRARVVGNYKNPEVNGELLLREAGLKVPYLNTDYAFAGTARINMSGQQFRFFNVNLLDTKFNTEGILNGTISHSFFKTWNLDLNIKTDRMLVLDTQPDDFSLYYGTAFISGDATIAGPTDELVINVTAKTASGTTFKIPLSDTESFGDNSIVYFLSPAEKKAREDGEDIVLREIKGLELNFDLEVTRDAEVEIVVDKVNGSTLRGRGAGYLLIQINTNGKFNMFGDFTPYEGVYNFRYSGVVQKQFDILPEGKISWDGSPERALLDISAVYKTQANPSILLENPSINRKIPVNVIINLNGQLVQPDITFDFKFPSTTSIVTSELEYRLDDRATRELQAFSLVTQGSFYSQSGIDAQTVAYGNLIETASGIFNNILSDDDGKFTVGLDYVQGDRTPNLQTSGRFGFTVSTQISKSILINGKVGVPVGGISESVVVGDVEVDFLLNEDGTLRATVFNRQDDIQFFGQREGYTQGVGINYSVDFDTVKELFRKILKGKATAVSGDNDVQIAPADSEMPYEGNEQNY